MRVGVGRDGAWKGREGGRKEKRRKGVREGWKGLVRGRGGEGMQRARAGKGGR